jgi:putative hydrolase of HD superfamily
MPNYKKITNFIFELNHLKYQRHSGLQLAGAKNLDSVAEHAWRAAQIGYILAEFEGVNPEKVATMLVIHDNGEARTGDQNKVSARYFSTHTAEQSAFNDQLKSLTDSIAKKWKGYFNEFENRNTKEGVVAKDADWLEVAFQAKEYVDLGYKAAQDWINNVEKALETNSAKKILKEMKKSNFTDWWQGLKKMTYKKLNSNS